MTPMQVQHEPDDEKSDLQEAFSPGTLSNNAGNSLDDELDDGDLRDVRDESGSDVLSDSCSISSAMNQEEEGEEEERGTNSIVSEKQSPVSFQPKNAAQESESHDAISESLSMLNDQLGDLVEPEYNQQSQKHALMESLKAGELLLNFGLDERM